MRFSDTTLHYYPYPLAILARRFNHAAGGIDRYICLASLSELTLKYLATIALAQYLQNSVRDMTVQRALRKLDRPPLGTWHDILRSCVRFHAKHTNRCSAVSRLCECYDTRLHQQGQDADKMLLWYDAMTEYVSNENKVKRSNVKLQHLFKKLVEYRNITWGHGIRQMTPEFCERHAVPFQQGLQSLLNWLSFLTEYPLRYVKEVRSISGRNMHLVFDYMGTTHSQGESYIGEHVREGRLYLYGPQGNPPISLHPFFVVSQRRLYTLEHYKLRRCYHYSDCETGRIYRPDQISHSALSQLVDDRHGKLKESDLELPDPPSNDGLESNEVLYLVHQLSPEGRQALEIAIGEAIRINHFWLGTEFLLMGLSEQEGRPLSNLLHELRISPRDFRGTLRGQAGPFADDWRQADVLQLGAQAFKELQATDPDTLAADYVTQQKRSPIITPRMMQILRKGAQIAGMGTIDHIHLLLAALKESQSLAISFLFGEAAQVGWEPEDVFTWVQRQTEIQSLDSQLPYGDG